MDLNNLIMTVVTATAALIAVIGGFLISRVITLASEQNGIRRKLRNYKNDIVIKKLLLRNLKKEVLAEDIEDFIQRFYKSIVFERKPLNQLLAEEDYNTRKFEELAPYVAELAQVYLDLFELTDGGQKVESDFKNFASSEIFKFPTKKHWYSLLYDEMQKTNEEEKKRQGRPFQDKITDIPEIVTRSEQKEEDVKELQHTLRILRLQHSEQEKILEDYGKPQGLWWGLLVLGYASIVGIAYPASLLPYPKNYYDDSDTKLLILILFYSQLVALFVYLGIYMHKLTKPEPEIPLDIDIWSATPKEIEQYIKEEQRLTREYLKEHKMEN